MQKKLFLNGEGDKWYLRNRKVLETRTYENDILCVNIDRILKLKSKKKILCLEIGCADGSRLNLIKKKFSNIKVVGIDPSKKAIVSGRKKFGINLYEGTADNLKLKRSSVDILIYGFCLYLCDEEDYEKISDNANKVLKKDGFLIIYDFFSKIPIFKIYKHNKKVNSYKKDFRKIFKNFVTFSNKIISYNNNINNKDLLAISVLKKK